MMKFVFIVFILSSCSLFRTEFRYFEDDSGLRVIDGEDYSDHLSSLGVAFINSPEVKKGSLSRSSVSYLNEVYLRIVSNNELLFKKNIKPTFHLIKSKIPYIFSLPNGHYYFSSSLIKNFLRNESLLVSALSFELIKSHKLLYRKVMTIPVGYTGVEEILALTRLDVETKVEVYKWSYFVLKRAGYDPFAVLNWIQTQSKSSLDFRLLLGGKGNASKAEFLFKNFLSKKQSENTVGTVRNSSPEFYSLIKNIKSSRYY